MTPVVLKRGDLWSKRWGRGKREERDPSLVRFGSLSTFRRFVGRDSLYGKVKK